LLTEENYINFANQKLYEFVYGLKIMLLAIETFLKVKKS